MISIIHPSRSRPEKCLDAKRRWYQRMENPLLLSGYIVSLDNNDLRLHDYKYIFSMSNARFIVNPNRTAVDAINEAAKISTGGILIVVSDDTDCPQCWDQLILKATKGRKDWVMKVDDGIQKRIITMPVMDRAYYNRFGYIYNPIYRHSWADTELTEVAHKLGRVIVRNHLKFPHLHPEITKEPKDALYLRNDKTHDEDRHIYQERKRINFGL